MLHIVEVYKFCNLVEVQYEHFGEIIDRVDMRGEVALLSRNIVIEGEIEDKCVPSNGNCDKEPTDTFGGQIKVWGKSSSVRNTVKHY